MMVISHIARHHLWEFSTSRCRRVLVDIIDVILPSPPIPADQPSVSTSYCLPQWATVNFIRINWSWEYNFFMSIVCEWMYMNEIVGIYCFVVNGFFWFLLSSWIIFYSVRWFGGYMITEELTMLVLHYFITPAIYSVHVSYSTDYGMIGLITKKL